MDLKKLVEAGRKAQPAAVSDSLIRRKRILDAKRRMAARRAEREEDAPRGLNRIGDSARATRTPMRGMAAKRVSAMQGLRRKQDSAAKTYFALRKRIKDELAETESTDEAIDTAIEIMQNEVDVNPADVLAAVVEVISEVADTLPAGDAPAAEDGVDADADVEDDYDEEDEVADSFRPRRIVRRRTADSARRAAIRRRVLDAMAKRKAAARRVRDARIRRESIARRADSTDALKRRVAARRAMARRADSVNKRIVRR